MANFDFMAEVYRAAVAAGAAEIVVVDTLGIATPESAAMFVGAAREWVGPDLPIHWHGHNDFGVGTAISIAAVARRRQLGAGDDQRNG